MKYFVIWSTSLLLPNTCLLQTASLQEFACGVDADILDMNPMLLLQHVEMIQLVTQ